MKYYLLKLFGQLFGRKLFFDLGVIMQHLAHRMMGIGNYENERLSGEEFAVKVAKKLFKGRKLVFFDVGAGENSENTILINKYFHNATSFLFEPMPHTFEKLKAKFKKNKHINCVNIGLSNKRGKLELWDYRGKQTQHATTNKEQLLAITKEIEKTEINVTTLDFYTKQKKINVINFLKIDTEGGELNVLKGCLDNLKKIDFVQFEFNSMNAYSNVRFKDFFDLLNDTFDIYRLYQDGLLPIKNYNPIYQEIYEYQNYLAINKKYAKENSS